MSPKNTRLLDYLVDGFEHRKMGPCAQDIMPHLFKEINKIAMIKNKERSDGQFMYGEDRAVKNVSKETPGW